MNYNKMAGDRNQIALGRQSQNTGIKHYIAMKEFEQ
jgi:hypothetical protein